MVRADAPDPGRCSQAVHFPNSPAYVPTLTPTMAATTAFIGLAPTQHPSRGAYYPARLRYLAGLRSNSQAESKHQAGRRLDANNMAKAGNRPEPALRRLRHPRRFPAM